MIHDNDMFQPGQDIFDLSHLGQMLSLCDENLLGRKLVQGNLQLDLTGDFYKGEEKDAQSLADLMKNSDIINLVGEESVRKAVDEGIVSEGNVIRIEGVPHAQAAFMKD